MNKLNNDTFSEIKGFGYQPSYGSNGFEIWNYFNPEKIEIEIKRGREYFPNANMLRLWLSFDAFVKNPEKFQV